MVETARSSLGRRQRTSRTVPLATHRTTSRRSIDTTTCLFRKIPTVPRQDAIASATTNGSPAKRKRLPLASISDTGCHVSETSTRIRRKSITCYFRRLECRRPTSRCLCGHVVLRKMSLETESPIQPGNKTPCSPDTKSGEQITCLTTTEFFVVRSSIMNRLVRTVLVASFVFATSVTARGAVEEPNADLAATSDKTGTNPVNLPREIRFYNEFSWLTSC